MNVQGFSLLLLLTVTASGCASEPYPAFDHSQNILGVWDCAAVIEENGASLKVESKDTYLRNGASHSFGIMKAKFSDELPEIQYSVAGTSAWKIEGEYLIQTMTDLKIVNLTHPEFDDVIKLQDIFPENISESSVILRLTSTELVVDSESGAGVYRCSKASNTGGS
ncbi:hypothetical protein [Stutzerimonas chloritidismutans]